MGVHIWCAPNFPLNACEVRWLLEGRFQHIVQEWLGIAQAWRTPSTAFLLGQRVTPTCVPFDGQKRTQAGDRSNAGSPILPCNEWLEAEIERLPDFHAHGHFFGEWLKRYMDVRDDPPNDPRRSFTAAAEACIKRIRRKQRHRPASGEQGDVRNRRSAQ